MSRPLVPNMAEWGPEEADEFFRLLGAKLDTRGRDGLRPTIFNAVYLVAEDIAAGSGVDPVSLGDDIHNDLPLSDGLHDRLDRRLIWMVWSRSRTGSAVGLATLDLGTGKAIVVEPPDEDAGTDWQMVSIVDRDDREALRREVIEFIESRGWLPHSLTVASSVSRNDLHAAYTRALDDPSVDVEWESLQGELEAVGTRMPIDTAAERAKALDTYLEAALESR